jgi:hypothetical protein
MKIKMSNILFDDKNTEEENVNERCPWCNVPFSEHSTKQLVKCALSELKGGHR